MTSKVLVTGASGYIGRVLCDELDNEGYELVRISRRKLDGCFSIGSIDGTTDWQVVLTDVDYIVHLAARVHSSDDGSCDSESQFFKVNTEGTLNLAKQAAALGVKRFVFISSIGVSGRYSSKPFSSCDKPKPYDAYTRSKYNAEQGLKKISDKTGLEVVIIRPPLVYGKDAPGNFGRLVKLTEMTLPLPLGAIHNKRSFIGVDNLVDFIVFCIKHPDAQSNVFLVSDDDDVSTTELLRILFKARGKKPILLPINVSLLRFFARMIGRKSVIDKLACDLQVDMTAINEILGWKPALSLEEGIFRCFLDD
ncbi:NAD-dependent epimerase/dehydratase family protein [Endozoicomonas arenosclerae]|uniref:NAD-dependent epimerase/dehydratase family protein n=1 Tax=Endozoicomonas arenosclerae TaxID=1633495 RepID=UPI000784E072|nr:NAD-dependent epimerase/dehydratase family protein [Endozoicomonas arenosclerae]